MKLEEDARGLCLRKSSGVDIGKILIYDKKMGKLDLNELSPKELIQLSEETTADFRWGRSEIYKKAFDKYKEQGKEEKAENMRREAMISDLSIHSSPEPRFDSLIKWATKDGGEVKYPDLEKDFTEEIIDYYRKRARETNNPILKARYADFLWEFKKEIDFVRLAIEAYLDCLKIYLDKGWDSDLADSLDRALSIAWMTRDQQLIEQSLVKHYEYIDKLIGLDNPRYVLEIVESILKKAKKLKSQPDYKRFISAIESSIRYYENTPDGFNLQQGFMEKLKEIYKLIGDDEKVKKTRIRIARSFEKEAEWKKENYPSGNLVASSFYEYALKIYSSVAGFQEKVNELKVKIVEANEAGFKTEMKPIQTRMEITQEQLRPYLDPYKGRTTTEIFQLIQIDPHLVSSYSKAKERAKDDASQFVVHNLFSRRIMMDNICVKEVSEPEEKLEFDTIERLSISYKFDAILLHAIFAILYHEHHNYIEELANYLGNSELIRPERTELIKRGLKAFEKEEYIESMHILVFQIEGILRDLLAGLRMPIFRYHRGNEMRLRTLGDILDSLKQVKGFDTNILKMMEIVLCDQRSYNLRNKIAHGLLPPEGFTLEATLLLIFFLLKIAMYEVEEKKTSPNASE